MVVSGMHIQGHSFAVSWTESTTTQTWDKCGRWEGRRDVVAGRQACVKVVLNGAVNLYITRLAPR